MVSIFKSDGELSLFIGDSGGALRKKIFLEIEKAEKRGGKKNDLRRGM
jgi:hypothetical protein